MAVVKILCNVRDLRSATITCAAVNSPAMANCSIMPGAVCVNPLSVLVLPTARLVVSLIAIGGSSQADRLCSKAYSKGIPSTSSCSMIVAVRTAPSSRLVSVRSSASIVVQADVFSSAITIRRALLSLRTARPYPFGTMIAAARSPSATCFSRSVIDPNRFSSRRINSDSPRRL